MPKEKFQANYNQLRAKPAKNPCRANNGKELRDKIKKSLKFSNKIVNKLLMLLPNLYFGITFHYFFEQQ